MHAADDLAWLQDDGTVTVGQSVRRLTMLFTQRDIWGPSQDARALVGHATGLDYSQLVLRADEPLSDRQRGTLLGFVQRRLRREPVGRILGARDFRGLELEVSAATLEPREDTEVLVDAGLAFLRERSGHAAVVADLGTGTGAILLAVLNEIPHAFGVAVDISADALATARRNAVRTGVDDRFQGVISDYASPLRAERFDLILSNPPYIATDIIAGLDAEVREYDPMLALDGGADGLAAYRAIAPQAYAALKPGGALMVEIGFDQAAAVVPLFVSAGFTNVCVHRDLGERDRVVTGLRSI